MAKDTKWHDDYWPLLLEVYLAAPVGVKPLYSRTIVRLALELHIPPQTLHAKLCNIANLDTPRIERIWRNYADSPERLARAVSLLRKMKGFGDADAFFDGVEINETWEKDWQPLQDNPRLTPVALTLILNLYFQLTPNTMVRQTPEVRELAKLLKLDADVVVDVLDTFQHCDPYLNRRDVTFSPLLLPCQQVWQRYGNGDVLTLEAHAAQLKDYYL